MYIPSTLLSLNLGTSYGVYSAKYFMKSRLSISFTPYNLKQL